MSEIGLGIADGIDSPVKMGGYFFLVQEDINFVCECLSRFVAVNTDESTLKSLDYNPKNRIKEARDYLQVDKKSIPASANSLRHIIFLRKKVCGDKKLMYSINKKLEKTNSKHPVLADSMYKNSYEELKKAYHAITDFSHYGKGDPLALSEEGFNRFYAEFTDEVRKYGDSMLKFLNILKNTKALSELVYE